MRDPSYIAKFLGKKIVVKVGEKYHLYPKLVSIIHTGMATVADNQGNIINVSWEQLENPYILIDTDVEIEIIK